ncbi:MAG: hypothetical protein E7494_02730 [Ruminococcus albus]|nr:hypothetical protein [Ruminococcus albus]
MSTMKRPEMEVVRFKEADIIVASGVTLSGFYNGVNNDANAYYNGNDYNKAKNNIDDFYSLLPNNSKTIFDNSNGQFDTIDKMFGYDEGDAYSEGWNGTYKWDKDSGQFIKQ